MYMYLFPPLAIPFLHPNFRSAAKQLHCTKNVCNKQEEHQKALSSPKLKLQHTPLPQLLVSLPNTQETEPQRSRRYHSCVYSTMHANTVGCLISCSAEKQWPTMCAMRRKNTRKCFIVMEHDQFGQAKTSVVFFTLTASFSAKYASNRTTTLTEIHHSWHIQNALLTVSYRPFSVQNLTMAIHFSPLPDKTASWLQIVAYALAFYSSACSIVNCTMAMQAIVFT